MQPPIKPVTAPPPSRVACGSRRLPGGGPLPLLPRAPPPPSQGCTPADQLAEWVGSYPVWVLASEAACRPRSFGPEGQSTRPGRSAWGPARPCPAGSCPAGPARLSCRCPCCLPCPALARGGLSLASAPRGGNREGPPPTGPRPTLLPAGVGPLARPRTPHLLFLPVVPPFNHSTITPRRLLGRPCAGAQTPRSWAVEDAPLQSGPLGGLLCPAPQGQLTAPDNPHQPYPPHLTWSPSGAPSSPSQVHKAS